MNVSTKATIVLKDCADNSVIIDVVKGVSDRDHFTYKDKESNLIEVLIYKDGLVLNKNTDDYLLELHLKDRNYTRIVSGEGEIVLNTKVLAFTRNDDIVFISYSIEDNQKTLEIKYTEE